MSTKPLHLICPERNCSASFSGSALSRLHEHERRSHKKKLARYRYRRECPYCHNLVSDLTSHVRVHHERSQRLRCQFCPGTFSHAYLCKRHVEKVHKGIKKEPVSCPICEKQFALKQSLRNHEKTVHEGIRYPCHDCGKTYATKSDLNCHIKACHRGIKALCRFCPMEFGRPSDRNRHEKQKHGAVSETFEERECS